MDPKLKEKYNEKLITLANSYANTLIKNHDTIVKYPDYEIEILKNYIMLLEQLQNDIEKANELSKFSNKIYNELDDLTSEIRKLN